MKCREYIQARFRRWAARQENIGPLQSRSGERGKRNYTPTLKQNLFEPLSEVARRGIKRGAGGELRGSPCRMQALHSSSAMTVNLFHHPCAHGLYGEVAKILRVPSSRISSIEFERPYPIIENPRDHGLNEAPHLDVGLEYARQFRVGVECKLCEPFGNREHAPLSEAYLTLPDVWDDIPACRGLAEELVNGPAGFLHLDAAQLLKHILGLKNGLQIDQSRLVYLYYDAPGDEAASHRAEVTRFADVVVEDGITFTSMSVQEFIVRASSLLDDEHREYVDYLCERYL